MSEKIGIMGKCSMERPAWTICFVLIWILVAPGLLLTHYSVGQLIPAISDLPTNVITGFNAVFRFAYMEQDAKDIQASCTTVLTKCQVLSPNTTCPNSVLYPAVTAPGQNVEVDTNISKAAILKSFDNSLSVVKRVTKDKYFGTPGLNETAAQLDQLTKYMGEIDPVMKCAVAVPVYCNLFNSANEIVKGMGTVNAEIDKFKKSDMIERWDENKSLLVVLHGLPYILVAGMLFFSLFWLRGGVCCCCRGGTKTGFCLFFYVLLWLLSFTIYFIVCAAGAAIKYGADRINVPILKGNPTLKDAIDHIQTQYPEFWGVVFEDLAAGLDLLLSSAFWFVIAALLIALYSSCLCCCCPYRKPADKESS